MGTVFFISYAALWVLVAAQSLVLLGLVRMVTQRNPGLEKSDQLKPGDPVPDFERLDLTGKPIRSSDFVGRLTALLFVSTTCSTCSTTLREIDGLAYKSMGNVVIVCRSSIKECRALAAVYGFSFPIVPDPDDSLGRLFGIQGVPTAVLIGVGGRIQSYGNPMRGSDVERMLVTVPSVDASDGVVYEQHPRDDQNSRVRGN